LANSLNQKGPTDSAEELFCLPDDTQCEWEKLKVFVEIYNSTCNSRYKLAECLDAFKRDRPHPEILVQDEDDGRKIVIEHKIVVWPPDHLQRHKSHHHFMERIGNLLCDQFQDALYVIEVSAKDVEKSKKEIEGISDAIVRTVIERKKEIKSGSSIRSNAPIPWSFGRLNEDEMDEEDMLNTGVKIILSGPWMFSFNADTTVVEDGVNQILTKHLTSTSKKFEGYNEHNRIFVTEVFSKDALADHELIEKVLAQLEVPQNIDEIWVGFPRWISENDHVPCYRRIR